MCFTLKFSGIELPCTVLYKTEHWNVPDYLPWGVPLAYLYLNRFSELLVHKPGEGFLLSLLATFLSPVVKFLPSFFGLNAKRTLWYRSLSYKVFVVLNLCGI